MNIDLNCDLGEGEPPGRTRALMRWISSANVACGGHAGDLKSIRACVRLAGQCDVRLGAHPGPPGQQDFGRGTIHITGDELELLLLQQVSAFERIAREQRVPLHHIKLHGGLYHATEHSDLLARRYIEAVQRHWPRAKIYALAGGRVARLARRMGAVVWEEAFADRGYRNDGSLVPRQQEGALLPDVESVATRVTTLLRDGFVTTVSGNKHPVRADTICLHCDTPNAAFLAKAAAQVIGKA
jgi:5-oxoprolinase (ATP-hydrolysing) subunit A